MPNKTKMLRVAAMLIVLAGSPLVAQTKPARPDLMVASIQAGAAHARHMFTIAAEQMSEEDYAFKPTPGVRSFGQLLGHVADANYLFCAASEAEKSPPMGTIEKGKTTKAEIQKALIESFDYCDKAYASMSDPAKANVMRQFRDMPFPALAVLNFRNYHAFLHWGNSITYMRLRGKVPPNENTP